jgi:hypothetical protein
MRLSVLVEMPVLFPSNRLRFDLSIGRASKRTGRMPVWEKADELEIVTHPLYPTARI